MRIIQRDLSLLVAIALAAGLFFFGTRRFAEAESHAIRSQAERWYQQGAKESSASNVAGAVADFRKALEGNRSDTRYALALAESLERENKGEEARQLLMQLRESYPEDAEINLEVARVAAKRQDLTEASHFYRHALFGTWNKGEPRHRRTETLFELIRFELIQKQREAALSDALQLEQELEATDTHSWEQLGELYLRMNEPRRALQSFDAVLRVNHNESEALLHSAQANFMLGRFNAANSSLNASTARGLKNADTDSVTKQLALIFEMDPRARNLPSQQRAERVNNILAQALARAQGCDQMPNLSATTHSQMAALEQRLNSLQGDLKSHPFSQDDIADAFNAAYAAGTFTSSFCGRGSDADQAMLALATSALGKER